MIIKEKILVVIAGREQPQTGGTRFAREGGRALSEIADVVVKEWRQDFSRVGRMSYFLGNLEICKWLLLERPNVFYCDSRMFPIIWIAVIMGKLLGVKFVTTLQESHHLTGETGWQGFPGKLRVFLLKFVCQKSDLLIANSSVTRTLAINEFGVNADRVKIVFPGFESESVLPYKACIHKSEELRILCVSRYAWRKGVDILLEALKGNERSSYDVIVVGDRVKDKNSEVYWHSLVANAKGLSVELRGKADKENLAQLYLWADVVVVPSRYEAFGIVVLEALSNRVHVLASDALPDEVLSISNQVYKFRNEDSEDLSVQLRELVKLKRAGMDMKKIVFDDEKWSWTRFRADFAQAVLAVIQH